MRTILPEFFGSTARIQNNFYFSFLALNFVNLKPFTQDIILPVEMANNVMTSGSLNSFILMGYKNMATQFEGTF